EAPQVTTARRRAPRWRRRQILSIEARGGEVRHQLVDFGNLEACQGYVESFGWQKFDQIAKFNCEGFAIPAGQLGEPIVRDRIGSLLCFAQVAKAQDRDLLEALETGGLETSVTSNDDMPIVDNKWTQKAELLNALCNFPDLLL